MHGEMRNISCFEWHTKWYLYWYSSKYVLRHEPSGAKISAEYIAWNLFIGSYSKDASTRFETVYFDNNKEIKCLSSCF